MVAKILDGKQIAKEYRQRLKNQVNDLKEYGFTPKLSVILVGNDGASQSYVKSKKKSSRKNWNDIRNYSLRRIHIRRSSFKRT